MIKSRIDSWNLTHNRVIVRADLNLPLSNGKISSDIRLTALLPTLRLLLSKGAHVILMTHLGNPAGTHDQSLSTQKLIPLLADYFPNVEFAPTLASAQKNRDASLILLENLRFFDGEESGDLQFAQALASLGDYYVNDAFGTLHRTDVSVALLPSLFEINHRSCGLLVEKELNILSTLRGTENHPIAWIVGGGKALTKLSFITTIRETDIVIPLPTISNTYMMAAQQSIGTSPFERSKVSACSAQLANIHTNIMMPLDYLVASGSLDGPTRLVTQATIGCDDIIITIGPETLSQISKKLLQAKTIFYNGFSGLENRPETLKAAVDLMRSITKLNAFTIICGGDSIALAQTHNLLNEFDFYSTGGGATLAYLTGNPLPGLTYL